jgi:hypothetical protein
MNITAFNDQVQARIRDRFRRIQVIGGGAVTVSGADGRFGVSLSQPIPVPKMKRIPVPSGFASWEVSAPDVNGIATLTFYWLGGVDQVRYMVNGAHPEDDPIVISLAGGKKLYAAVTMVTSSTGFLPRDDSASPPPTNLFTGVAVTRAEVLVVGRDVILPPPSSYDIYQPDKPGAYDMQCPIAIYNEDGSDHPPYDLDDEAAHHAWIAAEGLGNMPFETEVYGAAEPPYAVNVFSNMGSNTGPCFIVPQYL